VRYLGTYGLRLAIALVAGVLSGCVAPNGFFDPTTGDAAAFVPGAVDAGGAAVDSTIATADMNMALAPTADAATPVDGEAPSVDLGAPITYGGDLSRGLILYLRLDDEPGTVVVKDGSGRGSIANLRSVDPIAGWSDGRFDRAVALAGQSWNGWVEVASNTGLNALNTQVTFALWVWRDQSGGVLISRRAVGPKGFIYEFGFNGDNLYARLNTAAAYTVRVTGPTVPRGRWVHVAMTFDQKQLRLHVDGREVGAAPYEQPLPLENSAMVVGGAQQDNGSFASRFPGRIDELAVYTRVLSSADLTALAAGAQPPSR
jgi:hypothetical protein